MHGDFQIEKRWWSTSAPAAPRRVIDWELSEPEGLPLLDLWYLLLVQPNIERGVDFLTV